MAAIFQSRWLRDGLARGGDPVCPLVERNPSRVVNTPSTSFDLASNLRSRLLFNRAHSNARNIFLFFLSRPTI